ncbi:hypothetical protein ACLKA6_007512 [Drosophila palustris]
MRLALAAKRRQGQQRPPLKKDLLPGRGEPGGLDDPHRRNLCGSRVKWYIRYLQQGMSQEDALAKAKERRPATSQGGTPTNKRSSSALTPPTDTPKRVRAAGPNTAESRWRESLDERPSTSAAAVPAARKSTLSGPSKKVKVAVLPVDFPQATDKDGMRPVPAPSEKMDMEQQLELSDELEGADVTLTPRYDEGNFWPPSSCELEPLF